MKKIYICIYIYIYRSVYIYNLYIYIYIYIYVGIARIYNYIKESFLKLVVNSAEKSLKQQIAK